MARGGFAKELWDHLRDREACKQGRFFDELALAQKLHRIEMAAQDVYSRRGRLCIGRDRWDALLSALLGKDLE